MSQRSGQPECLELPYGKVSPRLPASAPAPLSRARSPIRGAVSPLPELLKFPGDRIHKGVIEAFLRLSDWDAYPGFQTAYRPASCNDDFSIVVGFRTDPGDAVLKFLCSHQEAVIKAYYALWARLYAQTGGTPGQWAKLTIPQLCADLNYAKHRKGGYRPERKTEEARLFEALCAVEVTVDFTPRGANTRRIRGPLWSRGLTAEEGEHIAIGSVTPPLPCAALWSPLGFTYGPGPWFSDPEWRRENPFLGRIGAGLLRLRTDRDQIAIRIGAYFGALGRMSQYRPRRFRIKSLLERIGMSEAYPRNPQRLQKLVEKGLVKLMETAHVLENWHYTDAEPDEPDMDDPEALAQLANAKFKPWRERTIEIEWPPELVEKAPPSRRGNRRGTPNVR